MSKRKVSDRQLAANRENAKKSTGPRTPEGKDRSSMNAWKHGITANKVCLDCETKPDFDRLVDDYHVAFRPINGYELRMVDNMAIIHWHQDRLRYMESAMIQVEILRPDVTGELINVCDTLMPTIAFKYLADHSSMLTLLNTQQNRLSREHARLHDTFFKSRKELPPVNPVEPDVVVEPDQPLPEAVNDQYLQNEPNEFAPAALSNMCSISYKTQPPERALARAA